MATDPAALYAARRYAEAADAFAARCAAEPSDIDAWLGRGQSLFAAGRHAEARQALITARGLARDPRATAVIDLLRARATAGMGHIDEAEQAFRAALDAHPTPRGWAAFGTFLVNQGRHPEAEAALAGAITGDGSDVEARATLATLRTQAGRAAEAVALLAGRDLGPAPLALAWARACHAIKRSSDAVAVLSDALARSAPADRAQLHHARALAYDQLGDIPSAASDFSAMHANRGVRPDPDGIRARTAAVLAAYPLGWRATNAPAAEGPRPLFLVGVPRSGTSLTEQSLAAHPDVHAAGEREELRRISIRLGEALGSPWPACVDRVGRSARQAAGMWRTAVAPRAHAVVVTDKMPDNLHLLGLAAQLFPDARAVWLRRDPMDTLLSCWQQAFGPGHAWTASWEGLAAMAEGCERIGQRWLDDPPMPIHVVRYEALVTDHERTLRELLTFAGLSWHAAVCAPEQVDRVVRTASILQVRERVHAGSVGRWHRYAEVLEPLRIVLEQVGIR